MKKMISFCGLVCSECEAYLATKNNDENLRKETAEKWSKIYNGNIKPEDVHCTGCISTSENVFSHCKVCEYRKCGQAKNVENCAHCPEYPCDKLKEFHTHVPEAQKILDEIHKNVTM